MTRFLFLFLFLPFLLSGQNWQQICSPGITLYQNPFGDIQAFRLDSIELPGNGDTLFFSYRTIRDQTPCADTTHGSVLGMQVYETASGIVYFYNKSGDTLTIRSAAKLNDSWKFCDLPEAGLIQATITSIEQDTLFGTPDSVKVITFQAYNSMGNAISHVMNGEHFLLSKSFGLSEIADIYHLPGNYYPYSLKGKTALEPGMPNLSGYEVYNFDVGDEFHYTSVYRYGYGPGSYTVIYQKIMIVLEKTIYNETDSMNYLIDQCINHTTYPHSSPPVTTLTHDTISITYNFTDPTIDSIRMLMPAEFFASALSGSTGRSARKISRVDTGPYGRQKQYDYKLRYYTPINPPVCWATSSIDPVTVYGQGLGKMVTKVMNPIYLKWDYDSLAYYKKGAETWGTPVATDCNTLLSNNFQVSGFRFQVEFYPNPLKEKAYIYTEGLAQGENLEFRLLDIIGREVYRATIGQSPFLFDRPPLPNGLYIWQVTGDTGTATGKLVLE